MTISYVSAVSTQNFINSIGINTHLDFSAYSSQLSTVISDLEYIGVKNIRDSANSAKDLGATGYFQQVANATGAKFDVYLGEGSVATMQTGLANAVTLAKQGIVSFIEGGNEEDQSYATSLGNSLAKTAAYQQTVYSTAHALGVSVINMSFGTGWSKATGNYGTVGNLSAYADYGNAHVYFGTGNTPLSTIQTLQSDAKLADSSDPVINTEMGWYTTSSTTDPSNDSVTEQAKYMLDGLLDAYQAGDAKTYLYELLDEGTDKTNSENNFGLFYSNGTAKPAATALHNLTTLLADSGTSASSFSPTGLSYQLSGLISTDHSMLMEKSDGTFWLAVWNEARLSGPTTPAAITVANHNVTLALGSAATIEIYDPMTGTTATQTVKNASTVTLSVPDHPILVEIIPGSTSSTGPTNTGSTGTGSTGTGSTTATASDLAIMLPTSETAYTSSTTKLAGVSISDAWASTHAGSMILNLTAGHNALEISNGTSMVTVATGATLKLTGSLAQLNADLATLEMVGGAATGSDTIKVDVWNMGGVEQTKSLAVNLQVPTSTSSSSGATVSLTANDLAVNVPTVSPAAHTTAYSAISGVSISDAWGAAHSGSMALNLSVSHGTIEISNGTTELHGSTIALSGTLAQLNADLQTLHYEATALVGVDSLSVNVWNQGGVSVTHALKLTIS